MKCKKEENSANCSCTYSGCPRKGVCCDCIAYHREKNEVPGCYFTTNAEKKYDRSVDAFINDYKNNKE